MHTILITGINGFVGHHLAREVKNNNVRLVGTGRESIVSTEINTLVDEYFSCDLTIASDVAKLSTQQVDSIIHLAGLAAAGPSFERPSEYIHVNTSTLINLAQMALGQTNKPRFLVVSSGALYSSDQSMPLTETSKIKFSSPYVVSKIAMENLCEYYRLRGLGMLVIRPFNHIGPGQKEGFIVPDIYGKLLSSIKTGQPLVTGNLKTQRDYTDVRDVARAYAHLMTTDTKLSSSLYNVCSGITHSGEDILAELKKHVVGSENVKIVTDQTLIRANDPERLVGSNKLINNDTGWQPQIPFEQTIADFVSSHKN